MFSADLSSIRYILYILI